MNEKYFFKYLDEFGNERLRIRIEVDKGEISNLLFQYETLIDNVWTPIVRYDLAHGFFHRDVLYPNGDKDKQVIDIDNLKLATFYAEQDLKDRWEFYKERYIKLIKK